MLQKAETTPALKVKQPLTKPCVVRKKPPPSAGLGPPLVAPSVLTLIQLEKGKHQKASNILGALVGFKSTPRPLSNIESEMVLEM